MQSPPLTADTLGGRCRVIAEVAQAHDGSLGMAHAYIDAASNAGADAVKFQAHIASAESTPEEPWRVRFSLQDATRYDYWRRMEFSEDQWAGLRTHATERGLLFVCSPFSMEAAEMLLRIGVGCWKVASGEINNPLLFQFITGTRLPVYVSTGMSRMDEVDRTVQLCQAREIPITLLQCTSMYPCPPEKVGLNLLDVYRQRYGCPVGLSDHSGTIYPGLAAAALGVAALEVHITFSRECFGPDVPASLTTAEFRQLVDGVRFIERMRQNPVNKDELAQELDQVNRAFRKSVVVNCNLERGMVLAAEHLTVKKPGLGIPAERLPDLIGRTLRHSVIAGAFLADEDLA